MQLYVPLPGGGPAIPSTTLSLKPFHARTVISNPVLPPARTTRTDGSADNVKSTTWRPPRVSDIQVSSFKLPERLSWYSTQT